jgi:hypothetical protein
MPARPAVPAARLPRFLRWAPGSRSMTLAADLSGCGERRDDSPVPREGVPLKVRGHLLVGMGWGALCKNNATDAGRRKNNFGWAQGVEAGT